MIRAFRKYHRLLAIIMVLPLTLTVLTGMTFPLAERLEADSIAKTLIGLHSGEIFGLEAIYPLLNGLGLVGLLVTGITMTGLFRQSRKQAE